MCFEHVRDPEATSGSRWLDWTPAPLLFLTGRRLGAGALPLVGSSSTTGRGFVREPTSLKRTAAGTDQFLDARLPSGWHTGPRLGVDHW